MPSIPHNLPDDLPDFPANVRCPITDGVWTYLADDRSRANNVQALTVHRPEGVPLEQAKAEHEALLPEFQDLEIRGRCAKVSGLFERALQNMGQLRGLHLYQPSLWPKADCAEWSVPGLEVWNSLRAAGILKHLEVTMSVESRKDYDAYTKLVDLTDLHLNCCGPFAPMALSFRDLMTPLQRSPHLNTLMIVLRTSGDVSALFGEARFPELSQFHLSTTDVPISAQSAALVPDFLAAHPRIEGLHFNAPIDPRDTIRLLPGTLPILTMLVGSPAIVLAVISCPSVRPRPLEEIADVTINSGSAFWAAIPYIDAEKICELQCSCESFADLKGVVAALPTLTALRLVPFHAKPRGSVTDFYVKIFSILQPCWALYTLEIVTEFPDHLLYGSYEKLSWLINQYMPQLELFERGDKSGGFNVSMTPNDAGKVKGIDTVWIATAERHYF